MFKFDNTSLDHMMQTDNSNKQTTRRRIVIAITLAVYLSVWIFLFYAAHTATKDEANAAFAAGLLCASGSIFLPYFMIYIAQCLVSKGIKRKDYLVGLAIVVLPLVLAIIDIKSGNLK